MHDRAWGQQPTRHVLLAGLLVVAAAVILATSAGQHHRTGARHRAAASKPVVLAPTPTPPASTGPAPTTSSRSSARSRSRAARRVASQDPQDRRHSAAARRAARALARHSALQHIPYCYDDVTITLTGASRNETAVLTVTAPTLHLARVGYRRFLARYHDAGRAYRPVFTARKARHG